MTLVKICGLTRRADASVAERAGASFLGVILAGGPRLLEVDQARLVLGPRRHGVQRVAVFGDHPVEELRSISASLDLDVLQLHGESTVSLIRQLHTDQERDIWPVLRIDGTSLPPESAELAAAAGALVLDAKVVGQLGGTGVRLDWERLADDVAALREAVPAFRLVLAGGLRATNVGHAMALLHPDVVDVSSGVETAPGLKDPLAVAQFVTAVVTAKGTRT